MFSAAIFDMDGLLIDSERTIMDTWLSVARDFGVDIAPARYLEIVGRAAPECFAMLTTMLGSESLFREAQARVRQRLHAPTDTPLFPLKPGAHTLLTTLAEAGIPCAVASSSNRQEIESRLDQVGVLGFFRALAGGNEVPRGKPDPAVYQLAASRLQAAPATCLAFEDSENGARAADRAGMRVVTVPDLKLPTEEVAGMSFRLLGRLDEAVEHVPVWFAGRGGVGMA
ncbi:HAD family hydrolase [Cupriavidus sp. USMAA2-4]|uniref:HAD family hydrolase n=1 Tax=unclassified Cupriavidus TaxID=2640874 RepID=UPI0008A68CE0|nr:MULTISPECIES: HAD family phosphatase [unclassified Cupriavidus]AOY95521.1 HAD family hydrolase [Cupriavidus sp. USMAA2-4]AOZ01595.1 HAD family hydrolase [Cupriavidus sp. USMAHM13]